MLREIMTMERFIDAAKKEGFQASEKEAEVVLGYMEGHDYELGLDETGSVIRNDLDYKVGEEHWEGYSIREAILFAFDMCIAIQEEQEDEGAPDKDLIGKLWDDEYVLTPMHETAMNRGREDAEAVASQKSNNGE